MGSRLRNAGKSARYGQLATHDRAASIVRSGQVSSNGFTVPDSWSDFEAFALECQTRQRDGISGLSLYPWQRNVLQLLEREGSVVIAKSRQVGGSQVFILWALWQALTRPGFLGLVASKRTDDAMQLARRVRRALKGLNTQIKPVNDSLSQLVLSNDSQLLFRSSSPADGLSRSIDTLDFALADEYSFWSDGQDDALGSLGPAMANSANPKLIIVSTPNGQTDDYWHKLSSGIGASAFQNKLENIRNGTEETYQEIVSPGHIPVAICHWKEIPHYRDDPDFKSRMVEKLGLTEEKWQREFELNFEESATSVFDFALVKRAAGHTMQGYMGGGIYYAGLDPASVGKDYTVFVILRKTDTGFCVEKIYRQQSGTSEQHMGIVCDLITQYKPIVTVVEKNSIGALYLERIASVCRGEKIEGFNTSQQSKAVLIGQITLALERGEIAFPRGPIEAELLSYRRNGEKLEAAQGTHDDCVMSLGLALNAADYGIEKSVHTRLVKSTNRVS